MPGAIEFSAFLVVAFGYAFAAWGVLNSRRATPYFHVAAALAVFLAPLMIGRPHVKLRALASRPLRRFAASNGIGGASGGLPQPDSPIMQPLQAIAISPKTC